jgi:hypothetical protein
MVERSFETDFRIRSVDRDRPPEEDDMNDKSSNKWILFPRPNPAAALRLFCFHYACPW